MSTKLLVIVGSPRRGGNTDVLVDEAIDAFCGAGGEAEKLVVSSLEIDPCNGCGACGEGDGLDTLCVFQDDMTEIYDKMLAADALLWATPIYMWSPTAQMKHYIDRLHPFGDYWNTRWQSALNGTPVGLLIVYAEEDPLDSGVSQTRDIMKVVAEACGGQVPFVIHGTAEKKGEALLNRELVNRVREAMLELHSNLTG